MNIKGSGGVPLPRAAARRSPNRKGAVVHIVTDRGDIGACHGVRA